MNTVVGTGKKYQLELSELDITILLEALGKKQNECYDRGLSTKAVAILIERIYRVMGVRLG